jgi:hypothetical protein
MSAPGEILLSVSPMKIPKNDKSKSCCDQFTDENGHKLNIISSREDGEYCGIYWKFYEQKTIFVPYKKTPDGKIKYWAAPGTMIIGNAADRL